MTDCPSYAKAFEERCQQLDQFCHRLESISTQLSQSIASISHLNLNGGSSLAGDDELQRAAQLLHSMPAGGQSTQAVLKLDPNRTRVEDGSSVTNGVEEEDESESDEDEDDIFREDGELAEPGQFGSLVSDSYGRLRYVDLDLYGDPADVSDISGGPTTSSSKPPKAYHQAPTHRHHHPSSTLLLPPKPTEGVSNYLFLCKGITGRKTPICPPLPACPVRHSSLPTCS